ncbi:2-oxo-4-hydroxy-4-carboxy-5-ureidoimidazoline decarboxylase [Streptomyces tagetis]|uniref:2-oxo-4-hydroxy-4-carboxy-5-ureidoimidazoline decarboxylase n=1 Tax=Streptomyces tagetis TaxID=2820809 RepID=UPI0027DBEFB7|nr:2-oxo-4-hydroxy-4-carboxy-5-ureidoimidazoline decarboxylase [Streptomyces sp. RG38]
MHRLPDVPGRVALPAPAPTPAAPTAPRTPPPLEHFNTAPADEAVRTLLSCLNSGRWARRLAAHRPYPDPPSLLAAADEAAYDLTPGDLTEALSGESPPRLPAGTHGAAHTALGAAVAAYESRFGHTFTICLDGLGPTEAPDRILEGIRSRLANDPEEERLVTADELRRLARGRLVGVLAGATAPEQRTSGT